MIRAEGISKRYGARLALDNLSFRVEQGEICGFLGPNGAGKTSTMRIITGFMPPTLGKASVAGFDIRENPLEAKKRIGYLPESTPLYGDMRVAEYLDFVAELKGISSRGDRIRRVAGVMEVTGVTDRQRSLIKSLSKGLKQRVGLAQALIGDPDVLILDEPTIGLDPRQIVEIRALIKDLGGKRTVILSSHILPEIQKICSRVLIINNGRLVAADTLTGLSGMIERKAAVRLGVSAAEDAAQALLELTHSPGALTAEIRDISDGSALYDITLQPGSDAAQWRRWLFQAAGVKGWDILDFVSSSAASLEEAYMRLISSDDAQGLESADSKAGAGQTSSAEGGGGQAKPEAHSSHAGEGADSPDSGSSNGGGSGGD